MVEADRLMPWPWPVAPEKEAGNTMSEHNKQSEHLDPKQAAEIERLRALTRVDGPGKTREERAIECLRAMLFTLDLGIGPYDG